MEENNYLLYMHYHVAKNDTYRQIIYKSAMKAYQSFSRRVFSTNQTPIEKRAFLEKSVEELLSTEIPHLLESSAQQKNQELFDRKHHEICESMIHIFDDTGGQTYGIVQNWLNLTLLNLVIIESNLKTQYFPITDIRKYFHIPIDQATIEAATRKKQNKFQHGLHLKCAPLKHNKTEKYQMDYYQRGETQPFEFWEYQEYIQFQTAVRNKINENKNDYLDPLDWVLKASVEVLSNNTIYC